MYVFVFRSQGSFILWKVLPLELDAHPVWLTASRLAFQTLYCNTTSAWLLCGTTIRKRKMSCPFAEPSIHSLRIQLSSVWQWKDWRCQKYPRKKLAGGKTEQQPWTMSPTTTCYVKVAAHSHEPHNIIIQLCSSMGLFGLFKSVFWFYFICFCFAAADNWFQRKSSNKPTVLYATCPAPNGS